MTVTGLHVITCPMCGQSTELLFRPESQDYVSLTHKDVSEQECASSKKTYTKVEATKLLRGTR